MADVFEVQDEIARKIAEALRVTLSPQEQQALAARPTENLQAYDLYLRGKSYARRLTRQDLEFALQMFENAVTLDPAFALAHAANAIFCAQYYATSSATRPGARGPRPPPTRRSPSSPSCPRCRSRRPGSATSKATTQTRSSASARRSSASPTCEGAYYLLGRALFAAGRYQEVADIADAAVEAARRRLQRLRPDHERAGRARQEEMRVELPASAGSSRWRPPGEGAGGRARPRAARRRSTRDGAEWTRRSARCESRAWPCARTTRPCSTTCACVVRHSWSMKREALDVLKKAWEAGFKDAELGAPRPRPRAAARRARVRAAVPPPEGRQ